MMNYRFLFFAIITIFATSCSRKAYLPKYTEYYKSIYGSYIEVRQKSVATRGELISVDSTQIIVLEDKTQFCNSILISEITSYKLLYANPPNRALTNTLNFLLTAFHGGFMIVTIPMNIASSIIIYSTTKKAYTYTNKDLKYDQLRMFARFPQGLPPHVNLDQLQNIK